MIELDARREMVYGMGGKVVICELNSSAVKWTNKRDEKVVLAGIPRRLADYIGDKSFKCTSSDGELYWA
jgi:hypothetical protein